MFYLQYKNRNPLKTSFSSFFSYCITWYFNFESLWKFKHVMSLFFFFLVNDIKLQWSSLKCFLSCATSVLSSTADTVPQQEKREPLINPSLIDKISGSRTLHFWLLLGTVSAETEQKSKLSGWIPSGQEKQQTKVTES